jgi:sugar phosphate isomerase/epimerase
MSSLPSPALPRLALAVIGDEIGPSLEEMISFCHEHEITRLDMRTLGGRNLLGMTLDEVADIARTLEKAGLTVPTLVSPLLKWQAPGRTSSGGKVDFAFDPADCPGDDPLVHAFDMAVVLGAERIRVFSYLTYEGYKPSDLFGSYERLIDLAATYSMTVEIENEPVCNMATIGDLAEFFDSLAAAMAPSPLGLWLRPLVDIGNAWAIERPPSDADIAAIASRVDQIHLKDRDAAARKTVPLGDGDIPWADELRRLLGEVGRAEKGAKEILACIETHCPQDARNATSRSVKEFRRICQEVGFELV